MIQGVLTTEQAGRELGVSGATIRKLIDHGGLEGFKVPGSRHRRVTLEQLIEFAREHGVPLQRREERYSAS